MTQPDSGWLRRQCQQSIERIQAIERLTAVEERGADNEGYVRVRITDLRVALNSLALALGTIDRLSDKGNR